METRSGNILENTRSCSMDSVRVLIAYDGSGRRVSKTRERKACISETSSGATSERTYAADWERELVTHYTGIGTEVREIHVNGQDETKVVVNMPQGLGRYMPEDASAPVVPSTTLDENGKPTDWSVFNPKFEWYLKNHQGESSENVLVHFHCRAAECCALRHNHLGSTMMVYGTGDGAGSVKAAYDYRAFGEQVTLSEPTEKVTENFTGKERDDETELNYFGARYLDPMLGLWISVDPKRQFASPYLYAGNGMNPVNGVDGDGEKFVDATGERLYEVAEKSNFWNKPEIESAYKFAKTSPVEISLKRESGFIERDGMFYSGMTDPNDKEILTSATVSFSADAARAFSSEYGISFQEATARILTHEYNAHVKNFVPASVAKKAGKDAVDMEHQKNSDFEKVLFPGHEELGE